MAGRLTGLMQVPEWSRGPARIEGAEIVLNEDAAETYQSYELGSDLRLPLDLADLRDGDPQKAVAFVRRYGLLWHGPSDVGKGTCREYLRGWQIAAHELTITIYLHETLRLSIDLDSVEHVRNYLVNMRDRGIFPAPIPTEKEECLHYASIQLAERVTRGLEGCTWTLVAASLRKNGAEEGGAGSFRFGENPSDLVAAAHAHLAYLITDKEEFRECLWCEKLFRPKHGRQTYCEPSCSDSMRQHRQRAKKAESA